MYCIGCGAKLTSDGDFEAVTINEEDSDGDMLKAEVARKYPQQMCMWCHTTNEEGYLRAIKRANLIWEVILNG